MLEYKPLNAARECGVTFLASHFSPTPQVGVHLSDVTRKLPVDPNSPSEFNLGIWEGTLLCTTSLRNTVIAGSEMGFEVPACWLKAVFVGETNLSFYTLPSFLRSPSLLEHHICRRKNVRDAGNQKTRPWLYMKVGSSEPQWIQRLDRACDCHT
jgi:hypothetical protein